ncbi:MAG TPA: peptidoglycan DD-metalloendopeptidase family protein [Povalibacter sp.]|uniref:peptidoglycan DD-metalloendopeptidase family protein n=1 Tax=Povalibacter sp. TaxID=1962978 RepID=UPI002BEBFEF9|nr:peptidoglycan DD-metalloendopeptidase family protein [Povalibacter sp.]HMN44848.1 peptidoglycan DD-metalloendopeptidase family protein [Povalibacter sp.]
MRLICALTLSLLVACSSNPPASSTYTVKRGDTLYSIAWRHKVDYQDLARWNGIGRDYLIHPGQVLRLAPPGRGATSVAKKSSTAPRTSRSPAATPPRSSVPAGPPVRWSWPVDGGNVVLTTRPNGGQGLTIDGRAGQDIRAAGAGRVVYSGTGLLGYGQLVIIKHNETYLSAYGHTQAVVVKEGDAVAAGQRIATMGKGPQGTPMLYFEIRIDGSPRNPLSLLPQRR